MNKNDKEDRVYCHVCKEWRDIHKQTYIKDEMIRCIDCNILLGYKWDLKREKNVNIPILEDRLDN